ncbi:rab11 family-interacting protein 1 [Xenopus laevis]|uniref:Rab11 family-interacting protein 2 n=2 Tax=Xenopus laevis TaxID=8355 RepID=A0A1L8H1C4_XENLA|nr:rab11 family-interacting protein 1 [Xenopus laevis]OCT89885.1 hypothetical protein XELAEV_18018498mg [Xenopus laevis]
MSLAQQSQTWFPTHVQVTVLQAKGLKPKGKAGTNDAYAIIQLSKEKYSTTVAEKSQAPVWKEEATFEVPLLHNDNQERCTVRVIVMHRALVGMDKFLGQLELNLWELHQSRNRRKVQWYPLRSKPGKKEKERGQIEVDVQFMRNNMTASMFDLSMKEKSRSTLGKLKDKIKGKKHDGFPDTASAIIPSGNQYDSDEEMPAAEKKKSKLKNLFSKPGLKKNSISQSMSVLPTFPPSSSPKTLLRPAEFSSDFTPPTGSPASERRFPHLPVIMTHKRTVSADTSQLNQAVSGNKKEGLSLFSGMKPKNDPMTRSNLCINGNHVYAEESEPRSESPKDNSQTNSPQILRKNQLYASAENLSSKASKETKTSLPSEKEQTPASSNDSLKSSTVSASQNSKAEEPRSKTLPLPSDVPKEAKENKKQENKKSSLLSLVTGKKETPKVPENEPSGVHFKGDMSKDTSNKLEQSGKKTSLNPFEDDLKEEKKPEPLPTSAKTTAVKPRLDVSSEAETKAKLSSSNSFFAASFSGGQDGEPTSLPDSPTASNTSLSTSHGKAPNSPSEGYLRLQSDTKGDTPVESYTDYEKPSVPLFWRSSVSPSKEPEPREVHVVEPFNEKNKERKTYVKSLLEQLTRKSPTNSVADADAVDVDLVKGVFPIHPDNSPFDDMPRTDTGSPESEKSDVQLTKTFKETPKPAPRTQTASKKQEPDDETKPAPPKPAPRSAARLSKSADVPAISSKPEKAPAIFSNQELEQASNVGSSLNSSQAITEVKMASPKTNDFSLRLDELPVIPENPEGTSDDEQLETKDDLFYSHSSNRSPNASATRDTNSHLNVQKNSVLKTNNDEVDFALDHKNEKNLNPECVDKTNASDRNSDTHEISRVSQSGDIANHHRPINSSPGYSSPTLASLPTDKLTIPSADSPTNPAIEGTDKVDNSGKKKLLRAWVSPSETHPIPTVQSGGTVSSRIRTNPVKPMSATQNKTVSGFSQPIKSHDVAIKKYDTADPAAAYSQLTHDELIQLVLKQKDILSKKDAQVRELEDYIDNLLVRIMEETPNILWSINQKAGKW